MARMKKEEFDKKFELIETKVKRTKHPNEWKYPGRSGNEHKMALMKYMKTLTKEEFKLLSQNELVRDPDKTENFLNEIQVGDLVGIKDTLYVVDSKNPEGFTGTIRNTEQTKNVTKPTIDFGLATEFAEILWRGDAPYGIDPEEEIKIAVPKAEVHETEEETDSGHGEEDNDDDEDE